MFSVDRVCCVLRDFMYAVVKGINETINVPIWAEYEVSGGNMTRRLYMTKLTDMVRGYNQLTLDIAYPPQSDQERVQSSGGEWRGVERAALLPEQKDKILQVVHVANEYMSHIRDLKVRKAIWRWLSTDESYARVARATGVSESTIWRHVKRLGNKLDF